MQKVLAYLKPIFQKKTTIFTFILIGIAMSFTVILRTYYDTSYNGYYGEIRENMYYNTFWVTKSNEKGISGKEFRNKIRKELENTEDIIGVFHNSLWSNGGIIESLTKNDKIDGRINLQAATNESLPELVTGQNFLDDDNDYIICPNNFLPAGGTLEKYNRFDMIDLNNLLNKEIVLNYMNYQTNIEDLRISLKLIGTYKNSVSLMDENICYVKESTLHKMYLKQRGITEVVYLEDEESSAFYVQVNKYENKADVKEKLENLGYTVGEITEVAHDQFEKIASNISTMNLIFNCVIFVLIFLILIKHFYDNLRYYNLLNILGYTKKRIYCINLISNIILILFSSLITLIISIFMKNILNLVIYFKPLIFSKFEIVMNYSSLWYIIPLAFITAIIVSVLGILKLKTDEVNIK